MTRGRGGVWAGVWAVGYPEGHVTPHVYEVLCTIFQSSLGGGKTKKLTKTALEYREIDFFSRKFHVQFAAASLQQDTQTLAFRIAYASSAAPFLRTRHILSFYEA